MSCINKIILVGHLGKAPDLRILNNNDTVVSFPLATTEVLVKGGIKTEMTEWHNIVMWRGLADVAAKHLIKGQLVYIEGKISTRKYLDKTGLTKYTTEIIGEKFTILGRPTDFESQPVELQKASDDIFRDRG